MIIPVTGLCGAESVCCILAEFVEHEHMLFYEQMIMRRENRKENLISDGRRMEGDAERSHF